MTPIWSYMRREVMKVRLANLSDLPKIHELAWAGYEEIDEAAIVPYDKKLFYEEVIYPQFFRAPVFILERDGQVIGIWGLTSSRPRGSVHNCIADYIFYIEPEFRSIKATRLLCKAVKDFADQQQLPIRLNYLFNGKLSLHERIFRLMGFKIRGIIGEYRP